MTFFSSPLMYEINTYNINIVCRLVVGLTEGSQWSVMYVCMHVWLLLCYPALYICVYTCKLAYNWYFLINIVFLLLLSVDSIDSEWVSEWVLHILIFGSFLIWILFLVTLLLFLWIILLLFFPFCCFCCCWYFCRLVVIVLVIAVDVVITWINSKD